MRCDITPGGVFPDYALPDHAGTVRTLSELQGRDPLTLMLSRGHYCPHEHQQHLEVAAFQSKVGVADTHMVTMSTPHPRGVPRVGRRRWTFLSDPGRTIQKDLEIQGYTGVPMIPHTLVLKPGPVIHSIYDGYWFWGRLSLDDLWLDLRAAAREIRPDWDPSTPRLREAWAAGDWSSVRGWDRRSPEHKARQQRRRHFNQTDPSRRRRRADMGSWTCQVTSERRGWVMELFPPMPLVQWQDTKAALHRFAQVVGKIRLAASVRRNHWWNVPFHVTGRGITSRPMGQAGGNPIFTIDFDFVDDRLLVTTGDGKTVSSPLYGRSVAVFYRETLDTLRSLGVHVDIDRPAPFDLPDADRPFSDDTEHASYDPVWATRYWQVLSRVNLIPEEFAARYSGKVSPVHHFWHTFDFAHTRFSERHVVQPREADPVTREAYAWEVISFGFWFGDYAFAEPAFYSYTAPDPAGLVDQPVPCHSTHGL